MGLFITLQSGGDPWGNHEMMTDRLSDHTNHSNNKLWLSKYECRGQIGPYPTLKLKRLKSAAYMHILVDQGEQMLAFLGLGLIMGSAPFVTVTQTTNGIYLLEK